MVSPPYTLNYRGVHDSNLTLQTVRLYKEDILALMEAVGGVDIKKNGGIIVTISGLNHIQTKMQQTFTK